MKLICIHKCLWKDRTIKPKTILDIAESDLKNPVILSSFAVPAEETPEEPAAASDKSRLTKAELRRRLDEIGVAYDEKASRDALEKIWIAQHQQP